MKNFCRQVLSLIAIAYPPGDIRVHQFKVMLVQVTKARGIALRRFDEAPLPFTVGAHFLCRLTAGHRSSMYINFAEGERLRVDSERPSGYTGIQ